MTVTSNDVTVIHDNSESRMPIDLAFITQRYSLTLALHRAAV